MYPFRITQEGGHQHHHLHDALADGDLFVLLAACGGVVQPEGGHHQNVGGRGGQFRCRCAHHAGMAHAAHHRMRAVVGAPQDARETHAQAAVAAEDLHQVAVQEAVVPDALEHQVQLQPDVLQPRQAVGGRRQRRIHALLVPREELLDDVVLVAEVVVQVARADLQLVGDMVGRDVGLAL